FARTPSIARAVRLGNAETAVPRLLAMLCILAVFLPSFFMQGAARALFVPLALAVGFAMITSYLLSSTFVPVLSVWLLRHHPSPPDPLSHRGERGSQNLPPRPSVGEGGRGGEGLRDRYAGVLAGVVRWRWLLLPGYLVVAGVLVGWWLL